MSASPDVHRDVIFIAFFQVDTTEMQELHNPERGNSRCVYADTTKCRAFSLV